MKNRKLLRKMLFGMAGCLSSIVGVWICGIASAHIKTDWGTFCAIVSGMIWIVFWIVAIVAYCSEEE